LEASKDDRELATLAAEKYARKLDPQDRQDFRKRLTAFLARRGFSYGTIAPVITDYLNSIDQGQSNNLENEDDDNG